MATAEKATDQLNLGCGFNEYGQFNLPLAQINDSALTRKAARKATTQPGERPGQQDQEAREQRVNFAID